MYTHNSKLTYAHTVGHSVFSLVISANGCREEAMYTDKMSPLGMPLRTVFIASIDIVGRGSGMPSARHRGCPRS